MTIDFGQPATLIDLDGTAPLIGTLGDCAKHFRMLTPAARADARVLLSQPTARAGRRTRTWVLNPDEIDRLAGHLAGEFLRDE
ncbi:hypothetical protein [Sphingomonas abietis]|uniref:Uncharacterized protein n=1 Tax=Sphingomonas abietis TaxID=3012344 RepID=A0ABY7NI18_9SPHN|nr:hypothetical protein [Sphingomonas abietis]WBO21177.1 hypothetical protein PBT88_13325 [Sphingomonas abietis]